MSETQPTADLQAKLRRLIDAHGLHVVADQIQLSRDPILRYLAGVSQNTRSIARIEQWVQEAPDA